MQVANTGHLIKFLISDKEWKLFSMSVHYAIFEISEI